MIKFSKDKVLLLHKLIAEETGGSVGIRDEALLESALENAFSGFGGQEFYPSKEESGARLGYTLISDEMKDPQLKKMVEVIGYTEGLPVVVDPGVLDPREFIDTVVKVRIPNVFMPDTPQRIATDTSQKLAIRFGETIKAYEERGLDKSNLVLIPLVLAGYARYLKGIDDNGQPFEISSDPLLAELQAIVNPLEVKEGEQDFSCLKALYSRADVFGVDLYAVGLGEKIEGMVKELYAGNGAVRKTLHKYTLAR